MYAAILSGLSALFAITAGFYLHRQILENQQLRNFAREAGLDDVISHANALKLVEHLRKSFCCDFNAFKHTSMKRRSFLRDDCLSLLRHREGLCGEGARVLICCLAPLGYKPTRVTLFTRWLHPSHTVVSLIIDEKEVLIDSLNSQPEFHDYLSSHVVGTRHFRLMGHVEDVDERRELKRQLKELEPELEFDKYVSSRYILFSYDAIPYTKLSWAIGLRLRIINLERPAAWISRLAEQPNACKAIAWGFISLITLAICFRFLPGN